MIYSNRDNEAQSSDPDSIIGLNMIFQFLFQELKDTKAVRRYIVRKMTMEFKELLNSKAAGKIIQKISYLPNHIFQILKMFQISSDILYLT